MQLKKIIKVKCYGNDARKSWLCLVVLIINFIYIIESPNFGGKSLNPKEFEPIVTHFIIVRVNLHLISTFFSLQSPQA